MRAKENRFRFIWIMQIFVLAGFLVAFGSCKDDDEDDNPEVVFKATLSGTSEVPPNTSMATGTATLTFNEDTEIFSLVVNFSGVVATNGHIHKAAAGVSGGVVFPFNLPITSPVNYTSPPLDSTQRADLFNHLYYVNIHSAAYGGGEIRGQLIME